MNKWIKLLIIILSTLIVSVGIVLSCTIDPLILKLDILLNISFILFGFLLTVYTFVVSSLNKIKKEAIIQDNKDLLVSIASYKKELKQNLIWFLVFTLLLLVFDFVVNVNIIINIFEVVLIVKILMVSVFIFNIFILFDTVLSIFKIVELE